MNSCSSLRLLPLALGAAAALLPAQSFQRGLMFASSSSAAGDLYGSAVGAFGGQVAVGAFGHDHNGLITSGGAWVRELQSSGAWLEAPLFPADIATQDQFGCAVAVTTNRVLVGSKFDDDLGSGSGSAYIFERQSNGTWLEVQKLTASDGAAGQEFGNTVAIDGDFAVVGCPDGKNGTTTSGTAYVFERQSGGTWLEVAKLLQNDAQTNDDFGWTVSISATRIVVGAYLDDDNGAASGSAYVFERQLDGSWPQVDKLIASDGAAADYFGYSAAISGDHIVVGAWLDDDHGSGSGAAYIFERQLDGTWSETAKVTAANQSSAGAHFGQAVAIEGDLALIGSIHDRVNNQGNAGSAALFVRAPDGAWREAGWIPNPTPGSNDNFAHAVALGGGTAIIGASQDDTFGNDTGAAGLFHTYGGYGTPAFYGTGTPGCSGPHTLGTTGGLPTIGNASFGYTDTNVPAGLGWLAVGTAADFTGSDPFGLGIVSYIDPVASGIFVAIPMTPSGNGTATAPLALPNDPGLVGLVLHAQSVWAWTNCPSLPNGLSSSNLASIAVLLP